MGAIIIGKEYPTHTCKKCGFEWVGCEMNPEIDEETAGEFNSTGYECNKGDIICMDCCLDLWDIAKGVSK